MGNLKMIASQINKRHFYGYRNRIIYCDLKNGTTYEKIDKIHLLYHISCIYVRYNCIRYFKIVIINIWELIDNDLGMQSENVMQRWGCITLLLH